MWNVSSTCCAMTSCKCQACPIVNKQQIALCCRNVRYNEGQIHLHGVYIGCLDGYELVALCLNSPFCREESWAHSHPRVVTHFHTREIQGYRIPGALSVWYQGSQLYWIAGCWGQSLSYGARLPQCQVSIFTCRAWISSQVGWGKQ